MDVQDSPGARHPGGARMAGKPPGPDADTGPADDPDGYGEYDSGTGPDRATGSTEITGSGDAGNDAAAGTAMIVVEIDGETRELRAERDYTGDGRPDAVVETPDGRVIVFSDTEDNVTGEAVPDGRADEAYVVDKGTGRVVGAAHVDPRTGAWVDGGHPDGPASVPTGSDSGGASS